MDTATLPALIDVNDVRRFTGLSFRKLYELRHAGSFPAPVNLGPRSNRWRTAEVAQWVNGLPTASASPVEPERLKNSNKGRKPRGQETTAKRDAAAQRMRS